MICRSERGKAFTTDLVSVNALALNLKQKLQLTHKAEAKINKLDSIFWHFSITTLLLALYFDKSPFVLFKKKKNQD